MAEPYRFPAPGSPADFQTFGIRQTVRPVTCAEVDCSPYLNGWRTTLIAGSDDEAFMLSVCRGEQDGYRRHWVKIPQADGFVQYVFEPGQTCFGVSRHQAAEERPPLYLRRDGDWRAHLGNVRRYDRSDQWADDLHARHDNIEHIKNTRS